MHCWDILYWGNTKSLPMLPTESVLLKWLSSEVMNIPHYIYPIVSHFCIVKLGFTRVYIFSYFCSNKIDCDYTLEPPKIYVSSTNKKNFFFFFHLKIIVFYALKYCSIRGVFQKYAEKSHNFTSAASILLKSWILYLNYCLMIL